MKNVAWAKAILDRLFQSGVDEIIVCPGARNAPFIEVLAHWADRSTGGPLHSFFEERSAGFFALGRIAATHRPKAVITTSGTAVANLLPPVVEAHYAGLPLVIVTADRPKTFRGTGSPQTIVQPGIFSGYARALGDFERGDMSEFYLNTKGPSHLNVCFDEPLIDEPVPSWQSPAFAFPPEKEEVSTADKQMLQVFREKCQRPLILVGGLAPSRRESIFTWLKQQDCPVYLEGTSGLRGAVPELELMAAEKTAKLKSFDGVIRIGQVPTLRLWRDLEKSETPVISISDLPFSGLARTDSKVLALSLDLLEEIQFVHKEKSKVLSHDKDEHQRLQKLLNEFAQSEPALVLQLSQHMQSQDSVYLGNSLPIREWDLAARRDVCFSRCFGNRGVNGIDGQISTFLGWAEEKGRNWAILGDLTAMYDLSAPWALRSRPLHDIRVVIINNGGGKIFQPMFQQPLFENDHQISFEKWAAMWKLPYMTWKGHGDLQSGVIEILPDNEQTKKIRSLW